MLMNFISDKDVIRKIGKEIFNEYWDDSLNCFW